jgi:TM2 domain-containing membrane protein YozV
MYCAHCGASLGQHAVVCTKCGAAAPAKAPLRIPGADKKVPAGICGILLGWLGIHKFILGYTGAGLVLLLVSLCTCGVGVTVTSIIGLIEGIIYLTKSDEEFVEIYVQHERQWF